ncbi:MAG: acyl-CoA synthetase [Actinobacteria bacterium]|nr:acyl-CoA synthetase [Actinomycetota bacterium]
MSGIYDTGLDRTAANFAALTPLVFLDWAADVYPQRPAVVHGARRYTWTQYRDRCRRLASALEAHGVGPGDTVAAVLANTPEMLEAHFGVPMTGAVLNAVNTRLDAPTIAHILDHGEATVLLVDREFSGVVRQALEAASVPPLVVAVDDSEFTGSGERIGTVEYEAFLAGGDPGYRRTQPVDEWQAISLNYTSGTTGNPKGVVYHPRGAHLNAVGNILTWSMPRHSVYLWTLPMFHCNGWCFPWTLAANAGTSVCLRRVDAREIYRLVREERVTHYCGAPIVHTMLVDAPAELRAGIDHQISAMVAAAPPPASLIAAMERIGIDLTHVYGLTEVYGPATVAAKQSEWADLDLEERARANGRQGVRYLLEDAVTVLDPETGEEVPADGETMGEIVFRGNVVMKGYLKNPAATQEAFAGGWYHSGDLAVREPDGYVKIRDRAKDVIISGGENISSVEVEDVLYQHTAVAFAAVVATPDPKWGETPRAYVELRDGATATEHELVEHCRAHLAHFKVPRSVVFGALPKTSTGKIQKNVLRESARSSESFQ